MSCWGSCGILEVCCLSSSSIDFTGYGWTLARDYAAKVDNEVEQKLTHWQDMQAGVRTATLLSSQMEYPRPPPVEDRKAGGGEKKDVCTTTIVRLRGNVNMRLLILEKLA